jgi:hypothetical protein
MKRDLGRGPSQAGLAGKLRSRLADLPGCVDRGQAQASIGRQDTQSRQRSWRVGPTLRRVRISDRRSEDEMGDVNVDGLR